MALVNGKDFKQISLADYAGKVCSLPCPPRSVVLATTAFLCLTLARRGGALHAVRGARLLPGTHRAGQWEKPMAVLPGPTGCFVGLQLDFTFVCPTEIIAHNDAAARFAKLNAEVIPCRCADA
jgi:hypothetical protein